MTVVLPVYLCPSDPIEPLHTYPFVTAFGAPAGDTYASCSYGLSVGEHDGIGYFKNYRPRPVTQHSGVFSINFWPTIATITDGTSNTFAVGEAASAKEMCVGIGCTNRLQSPVGENQAVHGWLVGAANPSSFFAGGFRYAGGWASTVERLNKRVVTDSYFDEANHDSFLPSWNGGTHRVPNFRSFHNGGANFAICDGSVQYLSENIDLQTFRYLSNMQDGQAAAIP